MSYDLFAWKLKKGSAMTDGAAYLCAAENLAVNDFVAVPRKRLLAALEATWGAEAAWPFECHISDQYVSLSIPGSQVQAVVPAAIKLFRELGLTAFDPQESAPTERDEACVAAIRETADRECGVDDAQVAVWRDEAANGDASAMNELGNCYSSGEGVIRNPSEAVAWYRRAAEAGCISAEINLIQCYVDGDGVPRDLAEARVRYEHLVLREHCVSAFALGEMYADGVGGPVNRERAIEMFTLARKNRHPDAYLALVRLGATPLS